VRVLLDENLPRDLVRVLPGHDVVTVHGLGWSGLKNGELLRRAAGRVDAFIPMDSTRPAGLEPATPGLEV